MIQTVASSRPARMGRQQMGENIPWMSLSLKGFFTKIHWFSLAGQILYFTESLKALFISNIAYLCMFGAHLYGVTGTLGSKMELPVLRQTYKPTTCISLQSPRFESVWGDSCLTRFVEQYRSDRLQSPVKSKLRLSDMTASQPLGLQTKIQTLLQPSLCSSLGPFWLSICDNTSVADLLENLLKKEFCNPCAAHSKVHEHPRRLQF